MEAIHVEIRAAGCEGDAALASAPVKASRGSQAIYVSSNVALRKDGVLGRHLQVVPSLR
jgi:hypothetical protein